VCIGEFIAVKCVVRTFKGALSQIAKPTETDFEQSMLPIFDSRKATNFTQSL